MIVTTDFFFIQYVQLQSSVLLLTTYFLNTISDPNGPSVSLGANIHDASQRTQ